jgi:hypothetical protein
MCSRFAIGASNLLNSSTKFNGHFLFSSYMLLLTATAFLGNLIFLVAAPDNLNGFLWSLVIPFILDTILLWSHIWKDGFGWLINIRECLCYSFSNPLGEKRQTLLEKTLGQWATSNTVIIIILLILSLIRAYPVSFLSSSQARPRYQYCL